MHRDDEDVFSPPTTALDQLTTGGARDDAPPGRPGPPADRRTPDEHIIETLEPLALPERIERLKQVVERRLGSVSVVLDNPHDPHNGSAVMRTCDALGVQRVHVLAQNESFLAAHRVAKGSHRWLDLIEHRDPESLVTHLRDEGFRLLVTHPEGELRPEDLASMPRLALVLGNERDGVSAALASQSDGRVGIPMTGFVESLNMSVSAALLLYQATRGRTGDLGVSEKRALYARWLRATVPRSEEILAARAFFRT